MFNVLVFHLAGQVWLEHTKLWSALDWDFLSIFQSLLHLLNRYCCQFPIIAVDVEALNGFTSTDRLTTTLPKSFFFQYVWQSPEHDQIFSVSYSL